MAHTIEAAPSGRAKCRGCGKPIAKGEQRLGERLPNPFADEGEMTLWFHLRCGAYKRPEVMLEALDTLDGLDADSSELDAHSRALYRRLAEPGLQYRRLPRVDGAERAASGRARCRHCKEKIAKGELRLRLLYYAEGRFEPSGFVHLGCAEVYFGTADFADRAVHFSPELDTDTQAELRRSLS